MRDWGWDDAYERAFAPYAAQGLAPARVIAAYTHIYTLFDGVREMHADVTGRLRFALSSQEDFPAVGDFVAIEHTDSGRARIHGVLGRRTLFSRKMPRQNAVQALCANIDTVFIVMSLNSDFNLKRLERFLSAAHGSGARLVILLSKADLVADAEPMRRQVKEHAPDVPVITLSCYTGEGMSELEPYLQKGRCVAVFGSSGVGKSTLLNTLFGQEVLPVGDIREDDDKGRHTTTHRQMVKLPSGALYIDTPGLREVALWQGGGLGMTFDDIAVLAQGCRFADCRHKDEPGCAVQAAVLSGKLSAERLAHFQQLSQETEQMQEKEKKRLLMEEKRRAHRAMGGKKKKRREAEEAEQDLEDGIALHEQEQKEKNR